jgi:hypothetical protein
LHARNYNARYERGFERAAELENEAIGVNLDRDERRVLLR